MLGRSRIARQAVIVVAAIAVTAIWVRLAVRPSSDLLNHRELGRRFLAGTYLYAGGLDYPYLPTWGMAHAPLAVVPAAIVSAMVLPLGVAALGVLIWTIGRLSRRQLPLDDAAAFWVAAAAIGLTSRFVIRDLLDGGENLMLTALVWLALYAWTRDRRWTGAWLLGAAIALKLTAAVFILCLFAWRERGHAARTLACAAVLIALPIVRMGGEAYVSHMTVWANGVWHGVASGDPGVGVLGPEPLRNLALRPALARLLVGPRSSSSWRSVSAWIGTGAMLVVVASAAAALWRRRAADAYGKAIAWAAAGVLGLLLSPITWRAHAVAMLPACYFLIRQLAERRTLPASGIVALAAIAIPGLVLARGVAGEAVSAWTDRWSLTTGALVCLLVGTLASVLRGARRGEPVVAA